MSPNHKDSPVKFGKRVRVIGQQINADSPDPDISGELNRAMIEAAAETTEFNEEPPTDISRVIEAVVEEYQEEEKPKKKKKT